MSASTVFRAAAAACLLAAAAAAQSSTGEIAGVITDETGAIVPGAQLEITNTGTNETRRYESDRLGNFAVTQLLPGAYRVSVEKTGFRRYVQTGIQLQVGQRARLDISLKLGAVAESVEVQSQASLLDVTEASLGQVIENRKILELPLNGRNIVALTALTTGVTPTSAFFGVGAADGRAASTQAGAAGFSVNGGLTEQNDVLMDGVPLALCCQNQISFLPSIDTTQEFRVRTNMYDAQYGRTAGGLVTFASKSGSNEFHGNAYEFLRNRVLDANNFFNNRNGVRKAHFVYNQFGASLGGRIVRNRTFFFGNFEGVRNVRGLFETGLTPTVAEREGRFAQAVYDPLTVRRDGNSFLRDQFPGNQIPRSRFDPVSARLTPLYPLPNAPGANNFISNAPTPENMNQYNIRVDHLLSATNRLFARVSVVRNDGVTSNAYGNIAGVGWSQKVDNRNVVLDDTITVTPTFILNLRYGLARQNNRRVAFSDGADLTEYGWPAAYSAARQAPLLPEIRPAGYLGLVRSTLFRRVADSHTGAGDATRITGRHFIKFGTDFRVYRTNWTDNGRAGGNFAFNNGFTRGPNAQTGGGGNAFASFLLGVPASGGIDIVEPFSATSFYDALYLQDDIRVTSKLTLNLGLRWEVETARTERYNRFSFFDPDAASPIASSVGIPSLRGGMRFAAVDGFPRAQHDTDWNNLGPRFGFAWNVLSRTVVRGGYGLTYSPLQNSRYQSPANPGFSSPTSFFSSVDGITPVGRLSDPFPTGITQPPGAARGLLTGLGEAINALVRPGPVPYNQQWSLNIQRELTTDLVVDVAYVGNKGTRLDLDIAANVLPDTFLSQGNALLQQVPNPFRPHVTTGTLTGANTTRLQLLRPFPHFTGVTNNASLGSSIYHAFQLKVNQRLKQGFSFLASYTVSKMISDAEGFQNIYNRRLDRGLSTYDIPQRLVVSYVWELPFGRGRRFWTAAPRAVDFALGGWQLNGITTFAAGAPVVLSNTIPTTSGATVPNNIGRSAAKAGRVQDRLNEYFDRAVFTAPGPFEFGTSARRLPDVRADGIQNFDVSLFKSFAAGERLRLQFRGEFFNLFNTPQFGPPNGAFGAPAFGVVATQANFSRSVQFALKAIF